jgi:molybdopterin converting factor small subunit
MELNMDEGAVLEDIIKRLALEVDPGRLLLGINGEIARLGDPLHDGDHVHLMLPISGGQDQ